MWLGQHNAKVVLLSKSWHPASHLETKAGTWLDSTDSRQHTPHILAKDAQVPGTQHTPHTLAKDAPVLETQHTPHTPTKDAPVLGTQLSCLPSLA